MRRLLLAVLAMSGVGVAAQQAVTPPAFLDGARFERNIIVRRAGPNRLEIDLALLVGASPFEVSEDATPGRGRMRSIARRGLADLRLFAADGREVPYLQIDPPAADTVWTDAVPMPIVSSRMASGFEIDLGSLQPVDVLRLDGLPAPFLKRIGLQGSGDRERWTVLSRESTVFDLPDQQLSRREVEFPAGGYRYLRLLWDDTNSARMPLPSRVWVRRVNPAGMPSKSLRIPIDVQRRPSEPRRSRFRLRLPAPRLPIAALELEAGTANLHREAVVHQVGFSGQDAQPQVLGRGLLRRTTSGGLSASELRIAITPPTQTMIDLVVDDGDNPAFDLRRVTAECAELPWIYFEATSTRQIVARYGRTGAEPPRYDLEARRPAALETSATPAMWGPPREVPGREPPAPAPPVAVVGATLDAARFRYTRTIPDGAPVLVSLQVDAALLAHSAGPAGRFRDVRILDSANRQVPYLLERLDAPLIVSLPAPVRASAAPAGARARASDGTTSVYRLLLPFAGLPPATLALATPARVFDRVVRLEIDDPAADPRSRWRRRTVTTGSWRHLDSSTTAPALTLALPSLRQPEILILVNDGDNSVLPLASADLLLPGYRLRFYRPTAGPLRLVYGHPEMTEPKYDLQLLSSAVMSEAAEEMTAEEEHEQPGTLPPSPLSIPPLLYYGLLAAAVAVIATIIVRLLRQRP